MVSLAEMSAYLDDYLAIRDVPDYPDAVNGLQVQGVRPVRRVATAVDACLYTIREAAERDADLLLVHHGLFWGRKAPISGAYYQRVAGLIQNGIGLYSCHIPLDAHPEVGNNTVLMRILNLQQAGTFGEMEGYPVGVWAETGISRDEFVQRVAEALGVSPLVMPFGPETVRRVGIVTGGAGSWIDKAAEKGLDTFLTGEGAHHTFFEAEERGLNVIYAGHYATETVGVRALGDHLARRFGVETVFIDHPTGL